MVIRDEKRGLVGLSPNCHLILFRNTTVEVEVEMEAEALK
jgi:hypothetical protein